MALSRRVRGQCLWLAQILIAGGSIAFALPGMAATEGVNPVSGESEQVSEVSTSQGTEIEWLRFVSGAWTEPVMITSNSSDDLSPQLGFNPVTGDTVVAYWRDSASPSVFLRVRILATGTWQTEQNLSGALGDSRLPSLAYFDGAQRVAFELRNASGARAVVVTTIDTGCPGPNCHINPITLRWTNLSSSPLAQMHAEDGHLWVDWIDSADGMGYSEYDSASGVWGSVEFRSITTDVDATRAAIRAEVIGAQ